MVHFTPYSAFGVNLAERSGGAAAVVCFVMALTASGCAFGPRTLEATHGRYNDTVRRVYEQQLLLNIVHQRYDETPTQLDVSAIAAQYELSAQAEAQSFNSSQAARVSGPPPYATFSTLLPDFMLQGANRPTFSFTPDADDATIRAFLTPATSDTLLFLAQSTGSLSTILRLWAACLNGVPAEPDGGRFQQAAHLLQFAHEHNLLAVRAEERTVQVGGPLPASAVTLAGTVEAAKNSLELRPNADEKQYAVFRTERSLVMDVFPGCENAPEVSELESILNLQRGGSQYRLVVRVGGVPDPLTRPTPPSADFVITPRSTAEVFAFLANGVDVPLEHFNCGVARPRLDADGQPFDARATTAGLFEVHACRGHKRPSTAYVAVKYRDYWYYIDDRDGVSKETFELMLQFSRLDFGRRRPSAGPVLTLPAGR